MISQQKSIPVFLFSLTLFLSAFLLFWVQLMVGKMILPQLGGSPGVWNTCLFFFQATLLLGYGYAHLSLTRLGVKASVFWQSGLLLLSLPFLPITLQTRLEIVPLSQPILWLLVCLIASVGLPFFVLSTLAPLLQRWLTYTNTVAGQDPYFLYAASNAGSLMGLVSYPLMLEPFLSLPQQRWLWTYGYGALLVLVVGCALWVRRSLPFHADRSIDDALYPDLSPGETVESSFPAPTALERSRWIWLAFLPSSLLLGVTTYLTTDLAAVPLLWAVPLMIYLLTFILAFANLPWLLDQRFVVVLPLVLTPLCLLFLLRVVQPLWLWLPLHLLGLFLVAAVCHGELARQRPHPAYLTEFYFWIALGGVLGGLMNAIAAPLLFPSVLEYPLILLLALLLLLSSQFAQARWGPLGLKWPLFLSFGLLFGGLLVGFSLQWSMQDALGLLLAVAGLGSLVYAFSLHPAVGGVGIVLIGLLHQFTVGFDRGLLVSDRSFFGVYRIVAEAENGGYHSLLHGTTLHGQQSLDPSRRQEPLTYYTSSGPIGQLFATLDPPSIRRVGVLGLGVGTIVAYSHPGQEWTFYEIDPLATRLATDPRYFTFLQEAPATVNIVLGDGRLALGEVADQTYDLLFIDAFNSDAIPVHLITQEAIELYLSKLHPHGLLVINITNRFLDLEPMLGTLAHQLGLATLAQSDSEVSDTERSRHKTPSRWVLMARQSEDFASLTTQPQWQLIPPDPDAPIWTDDFSNLLHVIHNPLIK